MVPVAATLASLDLYVLTRGQAAGPAGALGAAGTTLTAAFYLLIAWCYLRRGPAIATADSLTAHLAAVAGTFLPFAMPLLGSGPPGQLRQLGADLLLVTGTSWAIWSLRYLGRSLSVLAQARAVVDGGPYRWVRHPLYTGELVAALGLVVRSGTLASAAAWLVLCGLQAYRAAQEEQLLLATLPGYLAYHDRTPALLPVRLRRT
jgi:protein-S-isoprenylcysteine O-methyltransferase Ste14